MFIAFALIFLPQMFVHEYFREIYERDPAKLDSVRTNKKPWWTERLPLIGRLWDYGIWVRLLCSFI